MIEKDEMMSLLLAACPTFEPTWRAFLEEWQDEPAEFPLLYVALGDFVRHLNSMLKRGETEPSRGYSRSSKTCTRTGIPTLGRRPRSEYWSPFWMPNTSISSNATLGPRLRNGGIS